MIKWTQELRWVRAERCAGGNCVEVAKAGETVLIRDSKNSEGPVLVFGKDEWQAFVEGVKAGDFPLG